MNSKRYMGMYYDETELMNRVQELKNEGWPEENIYVVVKNDEHLTMMRSRTDAEIKSANDSWWDRFMGFISGEDHVHRMVDNLDFGPEETERYYREIDEGGMLLYVDQGEVNRHYMDNTDFYGLNQMSTDVNLGANGLSVTDQEFHTADPYRKNHPLADQHDNELGRVGAEAVMDRPTDQTVYHDELDALPDTVSEEERMRLHEERLQVDKYQTERGEVRLQKDVVEEPRSIDVNVVHDEITIERRPVADNDLTVADRFSNDSTVLQEDNETIRIPITEEHVEVTKKPIVTEEIVLKKHQVEEQKTIHESVKREEVHLDKEGDVNIHGDRLNKDRF
ncbi:YsnF/AvaK domain-containing protein [Sporosarcina obsidiansis]|uniref:YsnF/AvaK domain-containing protein n=1 Tax=Sporosarcina obsidiansis TaxID=2660748 RepID=UPI00129BCE08|nr:YsnF/AvaK domain-containing protein [Sporosarcina obsidiansis]